MFLFQQFLFFLFFFFNLATGNKEVVSALHKRNHSISYSDVRMQNKKLAQNVSSQMKAPKSLMKRIATHVTLDNNDGREETSTGRGTTHDTNFTIFQPILHGKYI